MSAAGRREPAAAPPSGLVDVKDLAHVDTIQALLKTLNDPRAGADVLARHVAAIPVLRARIEDRFARQHPARASYALAQQIALLGNRALEGILGELLEDLIMLHSEVEPAKRYSF